MSNDLVLNELSFRYHKDAKWLFKDLSFHFTPHNITAITGPNGSGKTTLLYSLCGIIPNLFNGLQKGHVFLNGEDIAMKSLPEISKWISFLLQEPDHQIIFPVVEQEIAFGAENLCLPPSQIERKIADVLSYLGVGELRNKKTYELSYGQKKIISLAALLVKDSPILVLDEPSAGLDESSKSLLKQTILDLAAGGKTIIFADHSDEMIQIATQHISLPYSADEGKPDAV
ncbi:MAG TPA: ABC transporter ATP-binding protein [Candidatus Cloacimonadota bacterium]|nr:ABC transporter ATP-binding protein [Candidatus Cloacimonadota bacterium]HPT72108.1 ABC transporter ATP-binding protein [Candidatus Cloacimonadota bacterium]